MRCAGQHRAALAAVFLVMLSGVCAEAQVDAYVPEWQTAAGGHQEFDVVSVRENKDPMAPTSINIPYGPEDAFHDTGGVLSAKNVPLVMLITFAFKNTTGQREAFSASLPDWVPRRARITTR